MSYPCARSQTKAAISRRTSPSTSSLQLDSPHSDPPLQPGMPYRRMYETRDHVRKAMAGLSRAEALLAEALRTPNCPSSEIESFQSRVRSMSAELASLQKKLKPLEANFWKTESTKKGTDPPVLAPIEPPHIEPPHKKKQKIDNGQARDVLADVDMRPMVNTATLDVALPPGGCTLTADECQYGHLKRLRCQYAQPFRLFCDEMDTISDSCLTGICLALPDMPWSIAVSRLAFIFKSTLDSSDTSPMLSDTKYLSAGTTIGCEQHVRYIRLAELMVIQDWRDFMRWAHHQSHVFNLCGQRSCIKLKHMVLEPIDCLSGRIKCRIDSDPLHEGVRLRDQSTDRPTPLIPSTCSSPGCWPPCLYRHPIPNILHSVAIEFAAFHQVSFGSVASALNKDLYAPINEHQLGKLVNNEDVGLIFPFRKSYGHILVHKWENESFVRVDTRLQIPPMYTSENIQHVLQKLPTRTSMSFNHISSSLFWYARRRSMPLLAGEGGEEGPNLNARFDHRFPQYQCPLCHGFDNYISPADQLSEGIADFGDFIQALQHLLLAHTKVPVARKVQFLYEETLECPTICDAWKLILQENYDTSMASLAKGEIPQAIANLCGCAVSADSTIIAVGDGSMIYENDERAKANVKREIKCEEAPFSNQSRIEW
ncbi:hypothetical protein F5Y10DRAFT_286520 [Nemania abortiva]|nr:hypothetical protein F5Y10DRAFT_286520 [Nemania abortiva]